MVHTKAIDGPLRRQGISSHDIDIFLPDIRPSARAGLVH